jgi:tetratricopeptide (TPR) repeat protein
MGTPAFGGDYTTGAMLKAAQGQVEDVGARCYPHSPKLAQLVSRMLAQNPADRPATVHEVLVAIDKITFNVAPTGSPPSLTQTGTNRTSLASPSERRLAVVLVITPQRPWTRPSMLRFLAESDLATKLARGLADGDLDDVGCESLNQTLAPYGAAISRHSDGAFIVSFISEGTVTPFDLLARAALCGLLLKHAWPTWCFGIGTGFIQQEKELRLVELIEHTSQLVEPLHPGAIFLDPELRHILEPRFEVISGSDSRCRILFEKGLRDAPRTVLGREVPCLGRDREIRNLEGLYTECVEESTSQVMIITGAAGVGKSRVAHEFLARIQQRGEPFELLVGKGDPMRADVSLGLVGQALREAAGITGGEPEEVQRKRLVGHVVRYLPPKKAETTAAFLGEIASIPFPDRNLPQLQAARLDPRLMADQTKAAWVDWLEAVAGHHPILILFEDLHWGDRPSVTYVDAALRILRERPLFVVALGRPEVEIRFPSLWRDRHPQRSIIGPLGNRAVDAMIRAIAGDLGETQHKWVVERGQGNPYYLEELLYSLHNNPDLSQIPETVVGMVQLRFDAVGEGGKMVLRAGSVFGQNFLAAGVKALVGEMDVDDVHRWLEILVAKEILYSLRSGQNDEFKFRQALHYETAYALLSPEHRVIGHRLAGEFLENSAIKDAIVLAQHFERGQVPERAVHWLCIAADEALETDDLAAAQERVDWGVRLGATGDNLAALHIIESELRFWKADYVEAERLAWLGQKSTDPIFKLRATNALIEALGPQAQYPAIEALVQELEAHPGQGETRFPWLLCILNATAYLSAAGDFRRAHSTLALLNHEADELPPLLRGRAEMLRSNVAHIEGRLVESMQCLRRAAEHFEEMGNLREASVAQANLGCDLGNLGLLSEAEQILMTVVASAEKRELNYLIGGCLSNLCLLNAYQGRYSEAREYGHRAFVFTREKGDQCYQGLTLIYLSNTELLANEYSLSENYGRQATQMLAEVPSLLPFAQAMLARALLGQGRQAEASALAESAQTQLDNLGALNDGEGIVRLAYVECLLAAGRQDEAKGALENALHGLREKAKVIEEPSWRQAFATQIPEHYRLIELAKRLELDSSLI